MANVADKQAHVAVERAQLGAVLVETGAAPRRTGWRTGAAEAALGPDRTGKASAVEAVGPDAIVAPPPAATVAGADIAAAIDLAVGNASAGLTAIMAAGADIAAAIYVALGDAAEAVASAIGVWAAIAVAAAHAGRRWWRWRLGRNAAGIVVRAAVVSAGDEPAPSEV